MVRLFVPAFAPPTDDVPWAEETFGERPTGRGEASMFWSGRLLSAEHVVSKRPIIPLRGRPLFETVTAAHSTSHRWTSIVARVDVSKVAAEWRSIAKAGAWGTVWLVLVADVSRPGIENHKGLATPA